MPARELFDLKLCVQIDLGSFHRELVAQVAIERGDVQFLARSH